MANKGNWVVLPTYLSVSLTFISFVSLYLLLIKYSVKNVIEVGDLDFQCIYHYDYFLFFFFMMKFIILSKGMCLQRWRGYH